MSANQAHYPVATMCRVLGVSPSGYYAWCQRPPSPRALADIELTERIRNIHERSKGTYGAPRIHAELADEGKQVGRKRVARLMQAADLQGVSRRRRPRTTQRQPATPPAPDLVQRDFAVSGPNRLWVADGRPFGRLVNVSSGTTHHQGCASSPWRSKRPSTLGSVSFQGTRVRRAGKADSQ